MSDNMNRLHELDSGSAWSYGFGSVWQRVLLFFGCGAFSTMVATFCCQLPDTIQALINGHFLSILGSGFEELLWSPLTWLGYILEGFSRYAGAILILPFLGAALLLILFGERTFWHGVFLILLTQPIQSLLAMRLEDALLSWSALGVYLVVTAGPYVRCLLNVRRV